MSKKVYALLLCLLLWVGACRDAPSATPVLPQTPIASAPTTPTATFIVPTATRNATDTPVPMEPSTATPEPMATLALTPTAESLPESFDLAIISPSTTRFVDEQTRLAIELVAGWSAERHNEQTIVLNKDNYYIDLYVTDGMSETLPTIPIDVVTLAPLYGGEVVQTIGRSSLIQDGKRVNYFYSDDGRPKQYRDLAFFAVLYANTPNETTDLPDEMIAEAEQMLGGMWLAEAYAAEKIPIPTFTPPELSYAAIFTSTDGAWVATDYFFEPFVGEDGFQRHRQVFTVGRTDTDEVWEVIDVIEGWGVDVGVYQPLKWVDETLYFTYHGGGACGAGINGSDVWSLNIETGDVARLWPRIGRTFAIDDGGNRMAVADWDGTFSIYSLHTQSQRTFTLGHQEGFTVSLLEWLPHSQQLLLVTQPDACSVEEPKRVYLLDITQGAGKLLNAALAIEILNQPIWLNDHELVVYSYWGERIGSYVIDTRTGEAMPFADVDSWLRHEDATLNLSMLHPPTWTVNHENGTTRFVAANGEMVVGVREYPDRNGIYTVHEIAQRIAPPAIQHTLTLTETTIGANIVYQTNANLWLVKVAGRYLGVESDDAEMIETFLRGFSAEPLDFQDNYRVISNAEWIAELRGGANVTGTFTVQRRDGTDGFTILDIPQTQGLGYITYEPLLFVNDALYYVSYNVADGCGGFTVGGRPTKVVLSDGSTISANFNGWGYTVAHDGETLAYFQQTEDETISLTIHNLNTDEQTRIPYRLSDGQVLLGMLFSADMSRIAVATQHADCNEVGWSIETIDLSIGEQLTYLWSEERERQFGRPTAWNDNIITLKRFWDSPDEYLNIWTGKISDSPPQPVTERSVREAQELLETHLRVEQIDALHELIADEFVIGDLHGDRQTVDRATALQLLDAQTPFRSFTISRPRNSLIAELFGDRSPNSALGREQQETTLLFSTGWNSDHQLGAFLFIEQHGELAEWAGILFVPVGNELSAFTKVSEEVIYPSPNEQWQAIARRYASLALPGGGSSEERYSLELTDGTNTQMIIDEVTVLDQGVRAIAVIGWSADSRYFHYVPDAGFPDGCAGLSRYHPQLLQIEIATGVIRSLFDEPVWDIQLLADGRTLLVVPLGEEINHLLYRTAGDADARPIALPNGDHQINAATQLWISPDSSRVIIVAYHDWCFITAQQVTLFDYDVATQTIRPIITLDERALEVQEWADETRLTIQQVSDGCPFLVDVESAEITQTDCD